MVQNEKLNKDSRNTYRINRKYKDSLFRIAFRGKEKLLELYNAINGSDYSNPEELTIYTIEDVVFMRIKNDISFLVGELLNLYEHQSTENANMPIRGLMYFAENYESYIARNGLDIYGSKLQKLPFPQYYVLYNGQKEEEDRKVLELKDAFPNLEGLEPCLNCKAILLNINHGHNREIMERSQTLWEYSFYVQRIRDNKSSGMDLIEAVDRATEDCIRKGILRDILIKNSAEVKNMVLGEWGTENHIRKQREEWERMKEEKEKLEQETVELKQETAELKQETVELKQEAVGLRQETVELRKKAAELEQEKIELANRNAVIELLTQKLLDAGRITELQKALTNETYRLELLEKYQLISVNR